MFGRLLALALAGVGLAGHAHRHCEHLVVGRADLEDVIKVLLFPIVVI